MAEDLPRPKRFCDMVMKGGITSGVVYPLAVARLSERFQFKNIGGTSAGAIAAAAAAAAELTRDQGGFERLRTLPDFLTGKSPAGRGTNLLAFFQPQCGTARLFRACLQGLGGGGVGKVALGFTKEYWFWALIGILPGLALIFWSMYEADGSFLAFCLVLGVVLTALGGLIGVGLGVARDVGRGLPANFFGLCTGMGEGSTHPGGSRPLTDWLNEYLNGFLGRGSHVAPLTFGDLWGTRDPQKPRRVNLEMMTTCLTHGRPYRLPFRDDSDVRESRRFYFNETDFRRLFPENIVDWMIAHPREVRAEGTANRESKVESRRLYREQGFHPLPDPADLPVAVAVRMSLSFPVLLSAIPLYAVDWDRAKAGDREEADAGTKLERCWFSDGGMCSNFPLHFFDAPLPRWPTLGINLADQPSGTPAEELAVAVMPESNSEQIHESWNRFEVVERKEAEWLVSHDRGGWGKLGGFFMAMVRTMQNWSDTTQSRLPGYRDRIAHVGLTPKEGGLNLDMDDKLIGMLTERGLSAADKLIEHFDVPSGSVMNWNNHRWLRMRACLASLDAMVVRIERACAEPQSDDIDYETWLGGLHPDVEPPSYPWSGRTQWELAVRMLRELRGIAAEMSESGRSLAHRAPRPRAELRPRAQI